MYLDAKKLFAFTIHNERGLYRLRGLSILRSQLQSLDQIVGDMQHCILIINKGFYVYDLTVQPQFVRTGVKQCRIGFEIRVCFMPS